MYLIPARYQTKKEYFYDTLLRLRLLPNYPSSIKTKSATQQKEETWMNAFQDFIVRKSSKLDVKLFMSV